MVAVQIFLAVLVLIVIVSVRPNMTMEAMSSMGNKPGPYIALSLMWWAYVLAVAMATSMFGLSVGLFDSIFSCGGS